MLTEKTQLVITTYHRLVEIEQGLISSSDFQSMNSVRDQMDQPVQVFSRPLSMETKTINNMDNRRNMDAKDGIRASDNLSVPRRQSRLPNMYAGAPESNL